MHEQARAAAPERERRGLEVWGPVGRWIFLNHPRGSWQYDLVCGLILLLLFLLPGL